MCEDDRVVAEPISVGPEAGVPVRGVLYGRQSRTTDKSESIATQRAAGRRAAKTFGVDIVAEVFEPPSTSAYKDRGRSRPMFPEVLRMIDGGEVQVVVAYKTDRISRGGGPGWAPLVDAAEKAGLDLDRFVLMPGGFMSEFEIGIRASMDREESKKIAQRSADNSARRAAAGTPSGGGHRPYGLHRKGKDRVAEDGSVAPCGRCGSTALDGMCEPEAAAIREIVARYLAGEGTRVIARALNTAAGIALLLGRPGWLTSTGGIWREGTVLNLLRSPHIAGLRAHNPGSRGENGKTRRAWDVAGPANWPTIIDDRTWERLKVRLENNGGQTGPSPWKYLLPRLLHCSRCGGRLSGAPAYGRPRYRCQKGLGKPNCGGITIICEPLDELIVDMLLYRLESPAVADALAGRRRVTLDNDDSVDRIIELEKQLDEAARAYARQKISMKTLTNIERDVGQQVAALRTRIVRHENLATINDFLVSGGNLRDRWGALSLPRRQALLAALIHRVVVHPYERRGRNRVDREAVAERIEVSWRV